MKKVIAIFCFAALLLSTSSLSYFYWLQEKLHEQERFASIDAGEFFEKEHEIDNDINIDYLQPFPFRGFEINF